MSIEEICKEYFIRNYTINDDESIDSNNKFFEYAKQLNEVALDYAEEHKEILKHINDIDPRLRDVAWLDLLNLAASKHLQNLYDLEENTNTNMENFKSFLPTENLISEL